MIPDKNISGHQSVQTTLQNDKNQDDCNVKDCFKMNNNTNDYQIEVKNGDSKGISCNNEKEYTNGVTVNDINGTEIKSKIMNIDNDDPCTVSKNCDENYTISETLDEVAATFKISGTYDVNCDIIKNINNNEDKITKTNTVVNKSCNENYSSSNSYVENCSKSNNSCNEIIGTTENYETITENCDSKSDPIESCVENTPISNTCDKNTAIIECCNENTATIEHMRTRDKFTPTELCDENIAAIKNCIAINNNCDQQFESQTYDEIVTPLSVNKCADINVTESKEDNGYKILNNPQKLQPNNIIVRILRVNLEKRVFHKCDRCAKAFLNIDDLTTHKKKHEERLLEHVLSSYVKMEQFTLLDKKFVCSHNNCSQCFPSKRELLLHKVDHIQQSVKLARQISTKLYENNNIEKPYKCEQCDFRFVAESSLNAHAFVHEPFQHVCSCGIGFYQLNDLKAHKRLLHHPKSEVENKPLYDIPKVEPPNRTEPIKVKFQFHKKKRIRGMLQLEVDIMQRQKSRPRSARNEKKQCKIQTPLQLEIDAMKQHTTFSSVDVEFLKTINKTFECPECKKDFQSKSKAKIHYYAVHRDERLYSCKVCGKRFTMDSTLTIHLKRHLELKNFLCLYCKKGFCSKQARELHERIHTGYKPYKCGECLKEFSDPSAFQRHTRIHTGDRRYKCPYCPNAYTDNSQLYIHRKRHENNRNFPCDKCEKKFYSKSDLRKHTSTVHNYVYNFSCKHCGKAFSSKANMQGHINRLHNSSRKTYNCPICFKTFQEPAYLKRHMELLHSKQEKKFVCEHCYFAFSFNSLLQRHIQVVHNKVKQFECDHCGSRFGGKSDLYRHMLHHHSSIKCGHCLQHFSSTSELKKHVLNVGERCDICDGEFFCKRSMRIHFRTHVKTDSTKFVCDDCGLECSKRQTLVQHILRNHAPRKYLCDHCKQRFRHKGTLKSHMITNHMDKLRCNVCYKGFISIIELKKHKKIGCTVQEYTCDVCNKTLTTLSGFKSHKRTHTGDGWKCKCPVCGVERYDKSSILRHLRLVHGKANKKKRRVKYIVPTD